MIKVVLQKRIIVDDGHVFDAEREVELPIDPFPGLRLYSTEWTAPDWDESEDTVEEVATDLKSGRILCILTCGDFRRESSGGDWTEDDVRELFQNWTLTRDLSVTRSRGRTARNGRRASSKWPRRRNG
jgi:hypothetical protein